MLIITLGDPLSVNQECLVKLADLWAKPYPRPVVLIGSAVQWELQAQRFGYPSWPFQMVKRWDEVQRSGLYFMSIDAKEAAVDAASLSPLERGQIATRALMALKEGPKPSRSLAVVTAPIDKHACALAGFAFPGQTEFFENLWGQQGLMLLAGSRLRVALATNHLPLSQVTAAVNEPLIVRKLHLLERSLKEVYQIAAPRLGVAALNPHAGDGGLFGDEDSRILAPAIDQARAQGLNVTGPHPADTLFFRAYHGAFDAVLAMYHDQGLGPLKSLHFYDAVNVTGGLPALRISPDHGPAADLYGRFEARDDSFRLALEQALRYLGW